MTATLTFRILGCGSSTGVPRLGNQWGDCDPANPKNRRSRCSLLITRETADGVTRVLIDTTPELFAFKTRKDRATKLLNFLGNVIVNGNPHAKGYRPTAALPVPALAPQGLRTPPPPGTRQRLR